MINMAELLLCTDMDRTIIPNGAQPEDASARPRFRAFCALPEVTLVYVSGRDKGLIQHAITEYELPQPDYAISDVGTRIYKCDGAQWRELTEWQEEIAPDWQRRSYQQLHELLHDIHELQLQAPSRQSGYKLSYFLALDVDHNDVMSRIQQRLAVDGIAANLVWSIDEPAAIGLLDVLPKSASKLHAIRFLQGYLQTDHLQTDRLQMDRLQREGLQGTGNGKIIFAGDSGNDFEVLVSDIDAVLVNNASSDLKALVNETVSANGNEKNLYLADADCSLGMNGNYAAGVLQGVAHFAPECLMDLRSSGVIVCK